ncbi:Fc receptor-like protein 5 [Collichthys lucidus]|uniref:Fc receptor-like protein 5 n=1 Tax=Collichthys lucidus TaxID=240159 RepID=A0A4U5VWY2_COLLU|nr:Fc receptor-like protein 5 [Collichthys lucidus]
MEATAFCIRLLMNVLMVLLAQVQKSYCVQKDGAAFPRVLPNRLQFFEYEFISFNCEFGGSAEWRVMRTLREITPTNISNWETSAGSGTINPAFSSDSGEYWCEDGDGRRSNALNISVTAGSVILESPVHVTEGDHVTLKCQKKKDSGHPIAEFYKDGLRIKTVYEGNMVISNVSASDEGLYKCYISGAGESPESWLTVRDTRDFVDQQDVTYSTLKIIDIYLIFTFAKKTEEDIVKNLNDQKVQLNELKKKVKEQVENKEDKFNSLLMETKDDEKSIKHQCNELKQIAHEFKNELTETEQHQDEKKTEQEEEVLVYILELYFTLMLRQQEDTMKVTALCFSLYAVFLRIAPNRQQHFEYERITFHCEGSDGSTRLRGTRDTEEIKLECEPKRTPTGSSCTIDRVYSADGGEYWCETEGGERSNRLNVTITTGSVILDSPLLPVLEGENVTLSCREKTTSSNCEADFYRDGIFLGNSSTGQMTIHNVSKSDEGLYKCNISDVGESPESWLTVTVLSKAPTSCPSEDDQIDTADTADNLSLERNQSAQPQTEREPGSSSSTVTLDPTAATDPNLPELESLYSSTQTATKSKDN